ncbi:MAG: hypothetical protein KC931_02920 [Candidatus Omnitrophica bacterium]|nr:hypothetical protein [Candidatus Omnitrophota bacterium]MCB9767486.1 hypothetical protein [Candidatus Omnitrophota bacterium]MCB9782569.1 hypothetical protein [Candidatus Omnitrophota bacterium]
MKRYLTFFSLLLSTGLAVTAMANEVTIGANGFLQKDGEPIFVLGAYHPPKGMGTKEVADLGFNLLRTSPTPDKIAECKDNDLWTWHSFNLDFSNNREKLEESIRSSVEAVKDAENLLIWESVDEPAWTDKEPAKPRNLPEPLTEGYQFLKSLDDHPVYLNHAPRNTVQTLRKYNSAADILCVDIYPILPMNLGEMYAIIPPAQPGYPPRHGDMPDNSPACVGDYVDKMREVADPGQAVFVVLQGFAWEALNPEEKRDPEKVLYPTYEQLRFMAWQAIVHGVNGLTFWGLSYNDNAEYYEGLSKVLHEIRDLTPAIVADPLDFRFEKDYAERGSTISKGIETRMVDTGDTITLFAVNASVDPATIQFSALPIPQREKVEVLGEDRTINSLSGSFGDNFEGLGVHIYRWKSE